MRIFPGNSQQPYSTTNTDYTNYIVQSRLRHILLLICYIGINPGTMPG
jgi:hypothetical protein